LPSLERRRLRGDLFAPYSFLRRGRGEGGAELFSLGSSDRVRGNGSKLHQKRFRLGIKKHFFTERVVKHWNRFPSEVASAPSPSVFKRHLDKALNNVLRLLVSPEVVRQLDQTIVVVPFQLKILCSNEYEASVRSDTVINSPFQIASHTILNLAGL